MRMGVRRRREYLRMGVRRRREYLNNMQKAMRRRRIHLNTMRAHYLRAGNRAEKSKILNGQQETSRCARERESTVMNPSLAKP